MRNLIWAAAKPQNVSRYEQLMGKHSKDQLTAKSEVCRYKLECFSNKNSFYICKVENVG